MLDKYLDYLIDCSSKRRSASFKIFAVCCGATFFLLILPAVFIFLGKVIERFVHIPVPYATRNIIAGVFICIGVYFLTWTFSTQWTIGKGTPLPIAPTQKLIVTGPYKYCRNPMKLGALMYFFGVTTLFAGVASGLAAFFIALILGSLYHKSAEEKELLLRFGDDYRKYRETTPFIIPRIWRSK